MFDNLSCLVISQGYFWQFMMMSGCSSLLLFILFLFPLAPVRRAQVHPEVSRQLLKDGYRLDEIPDDEDLDLIPPESLSAPRCCCADTASCSVQWARPATTSPSLIPEAALSRHPLGGAAHLFLEYSHTLLSMGEALLAVSLCVYEGGVQ